MKVRRKWRRLLATVLVLTMLVADSSVAFATETFIEIEEGENNVTVGEELDTIEEVTLEEESITENSEEMDKENIFGGYVEEEKNEKEVFEEEPEVVTDSNNEKIIFDDRNKITTDESEDVEAALEAEVDLASVPEFEEIIVEENTDVADIIEYNTNFPCYVVEAANYTVGVSSRADLQTRLNTLITKYKDKYWTTTGNPCSAHGKTCYSKYFYAWQCKGFAGYIFNDLFCGGNIGKYDSNMYYISSPKNAELVGKVWNISSTDTTTVKSILSKGMPGDFIQARRRGKTYGHSMIIASVTESGVYLFDCNSDGKCGVKLYFQDWGTFAAKNIGFSLYHSTEYPAEDTCLCSTSYAEHYICTTSTMNLTIRGGHGSTYPAIGSIPPGAIVYVSKANGNWAHIEYNGVSGYVSMAYLERVKQGFNPTGVVDDIVAGVQNVTVYGWTFDEDNIEQALEIHVYAGNTFIGACTANKSRTDVNNVYGVGNNHGYEATFWGSLTGTQEIKVFAINVGEGENVLLGSKTVDIKADDSGPSISNLKISNVSANGYTVSCIVEDETSVNRVQFPTWTEFNGQDDLDQNWGFSNESKGVQNGNEYIYYVNTEKHNSETGVYYTHIYAYDNYGNYSLYEKSVVVPPVTYKISYDANGGKNAPGIQTKVKGTDLILSSEEPIREKYTFEGWSTDRWASDPDYKSGGKLNVDANLKLYAVWKKNETYKISFDYGNGSGDIAYKEVNVGEKYGELPIPEYDYQFFGWFTGPTNSDGSYCVTKNSELAVQGDHILYARYRDDYSYTISYDGNGGENVPENQKKINGITLIISDRIPYREGYRFTGWTYTQSGTTFTAKPGDIFTLNGNYTLKAEWELLNDDVFELTYLELDDGNLSINGYKGNLIKDIEIPAYIGGKKVTSIGERAFINAYEVESVDIPSGISIGKYAFSGCIGLKKIEYMTTNVGKGAFSGCTSLEEIDFYSWVIEESTFSGCTSLRNIIFHENVLDIDGYAFANCTSLTEFTIPESPIYVGGYMFNGCFNLHTLIIPGNVQELSGTFFGCENLKEIVFTGDAPESIHAETFKDMTVSIYYPSNNKTWTEEIMLDYKGSITWIPVSYTIDYDMNCTDIVTNRPGTQLKEKDVAIKLSNKIPQREGYIFKGWSESSQSSEIITYRPGDIYNKNESLVLYAVWKSAVNVISEPMDVNIFSGEYAEFTYEVQGEDLSYQWQYSETDELEWYDAVFEGNTSDRMCINAHSMLDGYKFRCIVKDSEGKEYISETVTLLVKEPSFSGNTNTNINEYDISLSELEYTYSGEACEPQVIVKYNDEELVKDEDYITTYTNNIDVGTGIVTICGIGAYTGTTSRTFIISKTDIKSTFINEIPAQKYTSYEILPKIVVSYNKHVLSEGIDYSVTFENNIYGEKAVARIEGIGNYTGTREVEFEIYSETEELCVLAIEDQVYTGAQIKPQPLVYDNGVLLKFGKDYTLSYKNNTKVGTARIILKGKGNYTKSATVEFEILQKDISEKDVTITCIDKVYNGKEQVSAPTVKWGKKTLKSGTDYTVTYSEDRTSLGKVEVTITGKGNYTGVVETSYCITEKDISKAVMSKIPTQYYTGDQIEPEVVLYADKTAQKNGEALILATDYDVVYENNMAAGKGKIIITGLGTYGGTKTITFTISRKSIVNEDITIVFAGDESLEDFAVSYNGEARKPEIMINDNGRALEEGVDYELTYSNNIKAATVTAKTKPTITVKGMGNYTGSTKVYFNILPLDISTAEGLQVTVADAKYTGKAVKPKVAVTFDGKTLKSGTDYKVTGYYNNIEFCEKDQEKAAYVVLEGIKNYSGETNAKFRIYELAASGFIVDKIEAQTYTPHEVIEPVVNVYADKAMKAEGNMLREDIDYEIKSYEANDKAGTAKIVVTGLGQYGGTKIAAFKINKRSLLTKGIYVDVEDQTMIYSGSALKPAFKVMDGELELMEGTDYTVTYSNNKNVPKNSKSLPTITIKGKGNYTGTLKENFVIEPKNICDESIEVAAKDVLFNQKKANSAKGITTTLTVTNGKKKMSSSNYKIVEYKNNRVVGEATAEDAPAVVITGSGNYTGTREVPFRIYEKDISKVTVAKIPNELYTGKEVEPKPQVTLKISKTEAITLVEGKDYTLNYENNVKIGKVKIIITGMGEYGGRKTADFTILPKCLNWFL